MWCMHDIYWCGVKQESDCLHHGSGGVGLDADSKFTKQDRMRSQKYQSPHTSDIYIYCCDRKARTACAQSFTLWQQATKEITRRDHSIIACSCHKYIWVLFFATSRSWWITHSMQHQRRSCNISKFENFGIFSECLVYIFLIWHMWKIWHIFGIFWLKGLVKTVIQYLLYCNG